MAPIRSGGGSRTKFFEAMAAGLPVVTTPEGAEGLKAKNNQEIIIAKSNRALIKKSLLLRKFRLFWLIRPLNMRFIAMWPKPFLLVFFS